MVHDPLSPREALRTPIGAGLVALSLLAFVYSVIVVAEVLLGILPLALVGVVYLSYRTFAVLDSIADAAQRIADARERDPRETADSDASESVRSNRLTERER